MVRVPISFYFNILAGIIVIFNHFAASETGDVALNKVTGATGRFYTLFRDAAIAIQHGCTSHLETALCGPTLESVFPHDAVVHLRARYCHMPAQDSENVGGTWNGRQSHGGYGGSDFVYLPIWPLVPRASAEGSPDRSPFSLGFESSQSHLSQAVWNLTSKTVAINVLLLRTCTSWWWFRAPLKVTGLFLAAYSVLLALGYLFGASMVMECVIQVRDCEWVCEHQRATHSRRSPGVFECRG